MYSFSFTQMGSRVCDETGDKGEEEWKIEVKEGTMM